MAYMVRTTGECRVGCSKYPSSKATASKDLGVPLRYVEGLSEARTPLTGFFSILLGGFCRGGGISRDGAPQQGLRRNGATLLRLPRFLGL